MSGEQKCIAADTFKEGKFDLREWTSPKMTSPSDMNTRMYIFQFDFILFELSIAWLEIERYNEYENYRFTFSQWNELMNTAQRILNYNSFDDLFDDMTGLNILNNNGKVNILSSVLNNRGIEFWKNKSRYQKQLSDMREWTRLVLKENDTMTIMPAGGTYERK